MSRDPRFRDRPRTRPASLLADFFFAAAGFRSCVTRRRTRRRTSSPLAKALRSEATSVTTCTPGEEVDIFGVGPFCYLSIV
jgi:hypothetical protein